MLTNILTFFNRGQRIQPGTEATTHPTGHQSWWDGDAGIVVLSNDHHAWGRLFGVGGGGSSTRTVRRGSTFFVRVDYQNRSLPSDAQSTWHKHTNQF
jgi:hypothetical protein